MVEVKLELWLHTGRVHAEVADEVGNSANTDILDRLRTRLQSSQRRCYPVTVDDYESDEEDPTDSDEEEIQDDEDSEDEDVEDEDDPDIFNPDLSAEDRLKVRFMKEVSQLGMHRSFWTCGDQLTVWAVRKPLE